MPMRSQNEESKSNYIFKNYIKTGPAFKKNHFNLVLMVSPITTAREINGLDNSGDEVVSECISKKLLNAPFSRGNAHFLAGKMPQHNVQQLYRANNEPNTC